MTSDSRQDVGRYVKSTLAPDERILAAGQFPRMYGFLPALWPVSGVGGPPVFVARIVDKATGELAVADKRFVYERRFISRRTDEFTPNRIHRVRVTQSRLGRPLNYGPLHIEGEEIGRFGLPAHSAATGVAARPHRVGERSAPLAVHAALTAPREFWHNGGATRLAPPRLRQAMGRSAHVHQFLVRL